MSESIEAASALYDWLVRQARAATDRTDRWKAADVATMYQAGTRLSNLVLRDKQLPPDKVKAFEKAYRTFHRRRRPSDWNVWFQKNQGSVELLQEVSTWPDRGADAERAIEFGRFTIHNQTCEDPKASLRVLKRASDELQASGIPHVGRVLYGDVYIVGHIERKKTIAARYVPADDVILLLLVKRFAGKHERVLLHELGHRYWAHVLTPAQKRAWLRHHGNLRTDALLDRQEVPAIGERLEHVEGSPVITGFEHMRGGIRIKIDGGWIGLVAYHNFLRQKALQERFPTPYSTTDPEEHFAESFALRALGELEEPHQKAFDRMVSNRLDNLGRLHNRLAAR